VISHEKNFIFIHIPRCAGNSIEKVLEKWSKELRSASALQRQGFRPNFSERHFTLNQYADEVDISKFFSFAIVRHPLTRMRSIYKWGIEIMPKIIRGESANFKNHHTWKSKSFDEWVQSEEWMRSRQVIYKNKKGKIIPAFNKTQREWLCINNKIRIDYYGKFEDLNNSWGYVCNKLNINEPLPFMHSTSNSNIDCSKKTQAIIENHFKEDYEEFNY